MSAHPASADQADARIPQEQVADEYSAHSPWSWWSPTATTRCRRRWCTWLRRSRRIGWVNPRVL